ncbi:hypothetical protein [Mucisphaera sp.]|uniref:hypothetical protein n=1 Tax=Mucisphaera sp. TaxID=2913024 RepID=UPI003D0E6904
MYYLALAMLSPGVAHADWEQSFKMTPDDGAARDSFGSSVAISGGLALVGSIGDDSKGSAYLFDLATGAQLFKLLPNDGATGDTFGISVGLSGNTAIVGAFGDDDNGDRSGSAYLFDVTTGHQISKLLPDDGAAQDSFGYSVSISGGVALVGAFGDDGTGSAYLFDVASGNQVGKLYPEDPGFNDWFGQSVALYGNTALIGSENNDNENGNNAGSAYLFNIATGVQVAKLLPDDDIPQNEFGRSVALNSHTALVGNRTFSKSQPSGVYTASGVVYMFDLATGLQTGRLIPENSTPGDNFGYSVGLSGDIAVVGALSGESESGINSGVVYLFDITTGNQIAKLAPEGGASQDQFGHAVAIEGAFTLVGSRSDDDDGDSSGSAYVYDFALPGDLDRDADIDIDDTNSLLTGIASGSTDNSLDLDGSGSVGLTDFDFMLTSIIGTAYGDANLDLEVDLIDLSILAANFGEFPRTWEHGDFNGSGEVNLTDLSILASNFGYSASIPEASVGGLMTAGVLAIGGMRRRDRRLL